MRVYPLISALPAKIVYLISVQKEFPGPQGIMIHDIPVTVRTDMAVK